MENTLFALIRLGLENESPTEQSVAKIIALTKEDWQKLKLLSEKQSVTAIVLDGLNILLDKRNNTGIALSQSMRLEWIGNALMIEQSNRQQTIVMNELAGLWKQNGCRVMVMKGQSNGTFYPHPEHRSPGDIDCYLFKDYTVGNEIARMAGAIVDESWYKHSVISYKGETFENHQFFVHTRDGKRGKRLEKELEDALCVPDSCFFEQGCFKYPPVQWNAMFLTYHACAHFISEGLRLKQILDWAMFLKAHQCDVDWGAYYAFCERNHLRRFTDTMTTISVKYLGIKLLVPDIICDSPYADKVLKSALYDEDYVFGSGKGNWYNRFHLIKNMFHYRWKYEEIYQTSVWKQLWWYATGFILKTE